MTTKTSDTEDRSRGIDDKPRDQNPTVADGNEMSDSLPNDPDEGFQRLNREKNHQRVQLKQKKKQQQKERVQKRQQRHQGVEGSANDCTNLNKRDIPFESVT